jgi:protein-L-isoaspartate(D-aspartate) O-methyltransferase
MLDKKGLILKLKSMGIIHSDVINALMNTPRELFVSSENLSQAYENRPLSIDCAQTISQPYIVAQMTQLLMGESKLPLPKILEIGTGSGYQAAVLSQLAKQVYSIERHEVLFLKAQKILSDLGYENIFLKHDDGFKGWKEHAPYDAIIVTAAPSEIPIDLLNQLSENQGRMVVPVGGRVNQELQLIIRKSKEEYVVKNIEPVKFVPMLSGKT